MPWIFLVFWLITIIGYAEVEPTTVPSTGSLITNCVQLRQLTSSAAELGLPVRIDGCITFVAPQNDWLVVQDSSGGLRLSPIATNRMFQPGQAVRVQGVTCGGKSAYPRFPNSPDGRDFLTRLQGPTNWSNGYVNRIRGYVYPPRDGLYTFWIASDDDSKLWLGTNQNPRNIRLMSWVRGWTGFEIWDSSPSQKSEPVFLRQGQPCAIEVQHFDGNGNDHVAVAWEGPGFQREVIQGKFLSPWSPASSGTTASVPPPALATGGITREYWTNINTKSIEDLHQSIPTLPYLVDIQIQPLGPASMPPEKPLAPGQALTELQDLFRAEFEGTVGFLARTGHVTRIELVRSNQLVLAYLPLRESPPQLLGASVRVRGVCQSILNPHGHPAAGVLWVSDWNDLNLMPPSAQDITLASQNLIETNGIVSAAKPGRLTKMRGQLQAYDPGRSLRLRDGTNEVLITSFQTGALTPRDSLEVIGIMDRQSGIPVLLHGGYEPAPNSASSTRAQSPSVQLHRVIQVKQLNRTEAAKGYPARLSGVITYNDSSAIFLQDATSGIYVRLPEANAPSPLVAGTRVEVQGVSDPGQFAPIVVARQITIIGPSLMPEAKRHSWIQMMSGKDDAEWLEVDGIVSEYFPNRLAQLTVRMEGGPVGIRINEGPPESLEQLPGARIRVRGVCQSIFDSDGRIQGIRLQAPSLDQLTIVKPARDDPFQAPEWTIKSLGSYDMQSQFFERLKVRGTVTYCHQGLIFLQDEGGGLQATAATNTVLSPGDTIEVLGFPEMKAFKTMLVSAHVKPMAQGAVPAPISATQESIDRGSCDAMLVQLDATFLGDRLLDQMRELDLQIDQRLFRATLPATGVAWKPIPAGSRLQLTGVCVTHRDPGADFGQQPSSFELFLRDTSDLAILELPSWWTVRRAMTLGGSLVLLFLAALVWISQLRRQVDRQTRELKAEINERIRAEQEVAHVHKQLLEASRQAGMAEIATNVLHNVGNVLNSVNVSANLIQEKIGRSKASNLRKVTRLLDEHAHDLPLFLSQDERGAQIPGYLSLLADTLDSEQEDLRAESSNLCTNVDHIKNIVAMQQSYAGVAGLSEKVVPSELVENALKMHAAAYTRHEIQIVRDFEDSPPIETDKHKVMQILVNLLHNAKYACDESQRPEKCVTVRLRQSGDDRLRILVEDNGIGISSENLLKIFSHGFTARKGGHGFGLHYGANAAKELGGSLTASSEGPGQGAIFTLKLPLKSATTAPSKSDKP
jgi:signal transduction histidine kinase